MITTKNKYFFLPCIEDLFDQFKEGKEFLKLILQSGYNQIRVREEDIEKTMFSTKYRNSKFKVMSFDLNRMNRMMHIFDHFVVVLIDDNLIFSNQIRT